MDCVHHIKLKTKIRFVICSTNHNERTQIELCCGWNFHLHKLKSIYQFSAKEDWYFIVGGKYSSNKHSSLIKLIGIKLISWLYFLSYLFIIIIIRITYRMN